MWTQNSLFNSNPCSMGRRLIHLKDLALHSKDRPTNRRMFDYLLFNLFCKYIHFINICLSYTSTAVYSCECHTFKATFTLFPHCLPSLSQHNCFSFWLMSVSLLTIYYICVGKSSSLEGVWLYMIHVVYGICHVKQ